MSHSVSDSSMTDQYESAAESLNQHSTPSFISPTQGPSFSKQSQSESNEADTTIPLAQAPGAEGRQLDADEVETFRENTIANRTNADLYEEELEDELQRVATQLSHISRTFSRLSKRVAAEEEEEEKKLPGSASSEGTTDEQEPEEPEYDPRSMDWEGPEDKDCPFNWPSWKRWACTMTIAFLCLVITLGSSIYVDSIGEMEQKWGISQTLGLAGLTLYLVGLAFGPAVAAPLSELFGRKIVYCSTLPISMLFIAGVGVSKNIRTVLVLRFFAGFSSSGALAIGGGSITDIWRPQEMGLAMTMFCLAPLAGPVIGPVIGGYVCENKYSSDPNRVGGLRWAMWVDLFFAAAVFIPLFIMPETYKVVIMRKRIKDKGLKMKQPLPLAQFLVGIVFITLLKPMEMLVVEPIVLVFSIYTAFIFSVLFGFFEGYPVIFRGVHKFSLGNSGLPFLGVGIGLLIGACTYVYIDKYVYFKKHSDGHIGQKDKNGNKLPHTPESRLLTCKLGAVALGPSLFWLGWTGKFESVHYMAPVAAGVPFGFALILIFFSILTYFSMAYPPLSVASALAANNLLRYLISSVFPLFTVQMLNNLGIGWGMSVFGFIGLALAPVPWIFEKYGAAIRTKSRYGWAALMRQEKEKQSKATEA